MCINGGPLTINGGYTRKRQRGVTHKRMYAPRQECHQVRIDGARQHLNGSDPVDVYGAAAINA